MRLRRTVALAAAGSCYAVWILDESLGLRHTKIVHHRVSVTNPLQDHGTAATAAAAADVTFSLTSKTRPPPLGCLDWPAGRGAPLRSQRRP
jgi:hypothetical protein